MKIAEGSIGQCGNNPRAVGTALVSGHREGAGGGLALVREGRRAGHTADLVGDLRRQAGWLDWVGVGARPHGGREREREREGGGERLPPMSAAAARETPVLVGDRIGPFGHHCGSVLIRLVAGPSVPDSRRVSVPLLTVHRMPPVTNRARCIR